MLIQWQNVNETPTGGITIKGDPNMPSKQNLLWRFRQKWIIFEIENYCDPYMSFLMTEKIKCV